MCYPITHAWYVDCPITQSNYKPDAYTFPLELKSGWWLPIMFENFVMVLISQCRFKLETNYQILSRHFCQQISLLVRFFKLINVSIKDFWVLFIVFWSFISWFYTTLKGKTRALIVDLCRSPGKEAMIMGGNQSVFFFNVRIHYSLSLNFTAYQMLIDSIIDILRRSTGNENENALSNRALSIWWNNAAIARSVLKTLSCKWTIPKGDSIPIK